MMPELFEFPFIHVTIKSYGTMMVVGFIVAVIVMRHLARKTELDPEHLTSAGLYALISGVAGARVFYVLHHPGDFSGNILSVFAVWQGGLEFLGGVILAIAVIIFYLAKHKLPRNRYLDILAIGLMIGLGFGRIGCLMNGCCFGKPSEVPWAVRFPYASLAYQSQVRPNLQRHRTNAHLDLPAEYFGYVGEGGTSWYQMNEQDKYIAPLKPYDMLTPQQKQQVKSGPYRCLPVHPTQIYSSMNAFAIAVVLLLIWRKFGQVQPGIVYSSMLILYGPTRILLEYLRDDNPFEYSWWAVYKGGTVSQNMGIYLFIIGLLLLFAVLKLKKRSS